ncbi:S8 family peptidase [Bifidobacterium mongoliense]|jgi:hypothetical protein|uniref:S8 family peptidase n=1 Tax=Bifidobacterium mongoliense TaxID=518643 RepID=UPI0030ED5C96
MSRHYLIGRGEQLSSAIDAIKGGGGSKEPVYTFEESQERLRPELHAAVQGLTTDKRLAPNDVHVMQFVLHPAFIAKSYHPSTLINSAGLSVVGSKPIRVRTDDQPDASERYTSSLLVAGTRGSFRNLDVMLSREDPPDGDGNRIGQITRIERISGYSLADKLHETPGDHQWHELVLHRVNEHLAPDNLNDFLVLAGDLGIEVEDQLNFQTADLLYLPIRGDEADIRHLAEYSTVRAVRPMPRLKLEPIGDGVTRQVGRPTRLPDRDPEIREPPAVAVFDGGIPESNPLTSWIGSYVKANPDAADVPQYTSHGLAVCSALLFGNLNLQQPPLHTRITAVRVLDDDTRLDDPLNLYKTLGNIETVLEAQRFAYVNLSLGPDTPIEDDEVSAWTSVLDDILSSSDTLLSVAVGNNGELDDASGNNRIEPPGDAVNALCVGAADSEGPYWERAPYSAVGPGRSPGIVKPDILAFGGADGDEFQVVAPGATPVAVGMKGTSFAAPNALRQAIRIREICGSAISPLAAKTLLIHSAESQDSLAKKEIGWGRVPSDATSIVTTEDGSAMIIYQGKIRPGKYVRARIPIPTGLNGGYVTLSATFSFKCKVDPQSPDVYTRSALEITFRPNMDRHKPKKQYPNTGSFFTSKGTSGLYSTEEESRKDQGKWETVLHNRRRYRSTTLVRPVFDIHYNAREMGSSSNDSDDLEYALAITIDAPKTPQLHQLILDQYKQLVTLEPILGISGGLA